MRLFPALAFCMLLASGLAQATAVDEIPPPDTDPLVDGLVGAASWFFFEDCVLVGVDWTLWVGYDHDTKDCGGPTCLDWNVTSPLATHIDPAPCLTAWVSGWPNAYRDADYAVTQWVRGPFTDWFNSVMCKPHCP